MGLKDLPDAVRFRVEYFDKEGDRWTEVAESMGKTYRTLYYGERIPPFSERIPQNLRSFGKSANDAFGAYVGVLDKGAVCAKSVGDTLHASGRDYLRTEGYNEALIKEIEQELDS